MIESLLLGAEEEWAATANGHDVFYRDDENVLELDSGHIAQFGGYTKNHCIVHFKGMNFLTCDR